MNRLEYAEHVKKILEDMTNKEISIKEIMKENRTLIGIVVREPGGDIAPTFYVDDWIDKKPYDFVQFILNYNDGFDKEAMKNKVVDLLKDKEKCLENLTMKILNKERNMNNDRLKIDLNNGLIAIFGIRVNEGNIPITENIAERMNFNAEELFERAKKNLVKEKKIISLAEFMSKTMGMMADMFQPIPAVIVSNKELLNGASIIYTDGIKEEIESYIGDFVLIPSSIHEMIAVTKDVVDDLRPMIMEVNKTVLLPNEYLSDDVFKLVADGDMRIA